MHDAARSSERPHRSGRPFNHPVETGLRSLCVLYEAFPRRYDLQRLVFFDYLIVHSGDAPSGPDSLHPPTPFRSNEFLVRRRLVEDGIRLMLSRCLVDTVVDASGFHYAASESAASFIEALTAPYTQSLRRRAAWIARAFGQMPDSELSDFFNRNLDRWGSEFEFIQEWDSEGSNG
ncbi:ABC-three component system middle component 2 [Posidoniimonas corsicana]|uniref:ABC-three component system middle component 2 n=1 Tax=Posidoniimonas corsicana TaxID=1938618 RepID=UPI0028F44187|nr:ABC-three component system middle component 2 [Posidoniimonas corsicana]